MSISFSDCPHCNEAISKEAVAENKKYKNEQAIVVFACPHCGEHFKFSPYEYLKAKKSGDTVKLYKESEILKSEKMADSMFDWSGYPIKVAIGIALFAVVIFISD